HIPRRSFTRLSHQGQYLSLLLNTGPDDPDTCLSKTMCHLLRG
ncbi:unnamed protein product, partial [marine sediment metagenome]